MLQAYVDESGAGDPRVFVLAGYVAPAENWAKFSDDWREMLGMRPSLDCFKMVEMARSDERLKRAEWFYRIIERHVTAAVSCAIDVGGLVRAVDSFHWPPNIVGIEQLKNPYLFGFKAIIDKLAQYQRLMKIEEPIDFIFDEKSEKSKTLQGYDGIKLFSAPEFRSLMGSMPIYRDDKQVLPLQAADLYAWWVRKWISEGVEDGVAKLKFSWKPEVDIPRLEVRFAEDDFHKEFSKAYDPVVQARASLPPGAISTLLRAILEQSP